MIHKKNRDGLVNKALLIMEATQQPDLIKPVIGQILRHRVCLITKFIDSSTLCSGSEQWRTSK